MSHELSFDSLNEAILLVPSRVRLPDQTFDIGFEREAQGSEKLGHRRWADRASWVASERKLDLT